jgi:hypothetical protein
VDEWGVDSQTHTSAGAPPRSGVRLRLGPLIRYFSERNALAFLERGEVLLHALSYFRDLEEDGVRADPHEGTLVHLPVEGLRLNLVKSGETISVPYRFESTAREDGILVYCMSTKLSSGIAARFRTPVAVEVCEPVRFLGKLRSALSLRRRLRVSQLAHEAVRYYDWNEPPIVDWALPDRIALRKPRRFDWQEEYRFVVPVGDAFRVEDVTVKLVPIHERSTIRVSEHPKLLVKLGSLSSICRVHKMPIDA